MEKEENEENLKLGIGTTKLLTDDDNQKENIEEEFLKPTKIIDEEDPHFPSEKKESNTSNEIKNNKNEKQTPNEVNLFPGNNLDIDDDLENAKENDDENLFKPTKIVYDNPEDNLIRKE